MLEIRHKNMSDTQATQQAYNEIYSNEGIQLRDSFYLWLIGLLQPQPGKTLIDISCGQGRLTALAQQQGIGAIGIDFAMDGVERGRRLSPESGWVVGDGEGLPIQEMSADYITHIGSLEHYQHPQSGALEIARILKPDGKACILVPNAFGLLGNIRHVWATGDIFDDGQPLQRYGTPGFWQTMLISSGLKVDNTLGWNEIEFPRTTRDAIFLFKHPQKIIRFALSPIIPVNLTNHLVFICSRA